MYGRIYTLGFDNITVGVGSTQDLLSVAPAVGKPCIFHALYLSQKSEVKEAEEEMLRIAVIRGHTTAGSGGAAVTTLPPRNPNAVAAAFTARRNDTTLASGGTAVNMHNDQWNVRIPYQLIWTPELRPIVFNNQIMVVRLLAVPADSIDGVSATLYVEEL